MIGVLQLEEAIFTEGLKDVFYRGRWAVEGLCTHFSSWHSQTPEVSVQHLGFGGVTVTTLYDKVAPGNTQRKIGNTHNPPAQ